MTAKNWDAELTWLDGPGRKHWTPAIQTLFPRCDDLARLLRRMRPGERDLDLERVYAELKAALIAALAEAERAGA